MIFRQATPEDAKELITLTHTAFLRYAREVGRSVRGTSETFDDILYDIESKYVLLAVDEHDNKLAGAVRVEVIGSIAYISRLCSSEKYKDSGTGFQLIEKIKSIFDVEALCLHTSTKITSLVMFYYRCGFYIHSVNHDRGYPRGLFVCPLGDNNTDIDYLELTRVK